MSLGRNILWNLGGLVWITLLVIWVTPILVRGLGLDGFGIWAVLSASTGYLSMLDFGMGNALIRFLAAEMERGDETAAENFFRSGLTLQLIQGAIAATILIVAAPYMARHWFRIPPHLVSEAIVSFRICAVSTLLGFVITSYAAVPAALRRFDLLAIRTVLFVTLQYGLFVVVLRLGGGLREVVLANVAGYLVACAFLFTVARRLLPGFRMAPGWSGPAARVFLSFGRFKFLAQLSWTLMREFDRIAIGLMLPVSQVSFYAVPLRLAQRTNVVVEQIASPFYPSVTRQITAQQTEALRAHYWIGVRLIAALCFGLLAVLGSLARPLLEVWLGNDFAEAGTWTLRILLLSYTAAAFFTLPSVVADAAGRPEIPAGILAVASLVHIPLVFLGIRLWGISGAALGLLAGMLLLLVGVGIIHTRLSEMPSLKDAGPAVRGSFFAAVLTILGGLVLSASDFPGSGILPLLMSLVAAGLLYLFLLFAFRGMLISDVRRLLELVRGLGRDTVLLVHENRVRAARER